MKKSISLTAMEVSIYPQSIDHINVDVTLSSGELNCLLDEMEIDDIISFLKNKGYNVTT